MRKYILSYPIVVCLMLLSVNIYAKTPPKHEFRGVWLQTVSRNEIKSMTPGQAKGYFIYLLDELQKAGFNAVIFQIRPKADAFYNSPFEPWSVQLTGKQGVAPNPYWDPMAFLIQECHARNMEFHAWINPYRVTNIKNEYLAPSHVYYKHPEWFVKYDDNIYFDPGIPDCRTHICNIVEDIVKRYDVDAIHMDDYFYPYPKNGQAFPDQNSFSKYGAMYGYYPNQLADWRRNNVNLLVRNIKTTILNSGKPWVKFGISPFGIYRNKKNAADQLGSNTNGLQNYDDLYADVLCWTYNKWIDYVVPQIYWEIGNKSADYEVLIRWWSDNIKNAHLYIGQDVERSLPNKNFPNVQKTQLARKMALKNSLNNIKGNCFWYGYAIVDNMSGIKDSLKNNYHKYPALIPPLTNFPEGIKIEYPKTPKNVKAKWTERGYMLTWKSHKEKNELKKPLYYCIYRFEKDEKEDLSNPEKLILTTRAQEYQLPYNDGNTTYKYVVTSVNRLHFESKKGKKVKVKL